MKSRRISARAALAGLLVTTVALAAGATTYRRLHPRAASAAAAGAPEPARAGRRPVPTPAAGKMIRELSAGDSRTCALYTNGSVVCWGETPRNGPPVPSDASPKRVEGITDAVAISVGDTHGCVLDAEGRLSCWGYCDVACQAGTGPLLFTKATRVTEVPRLVTMVSESLGENACGVGAEDEELHCWGEMSAGVTWFGDPVGPRIYHYEPDRFGRGRYEKGGHAGAVELLASGSGMSCARLADGHARCWSEGTTDGASKPFAALEAPREPVARMAGTYAQACFVLASGGVECHSTDGILRPPFPSRVTTAAATASSVCATTLEGSLVCQRYTWTGEQRNVANYERGVSFEQRSVDTGGPVRAVVSGSHHYCALREDDAVHCWDEYGDGRPARIALGATPPP